MKCACLHSRPEIGSHVATDLPHLLGCTGTKRHADIVDAFQGVQIVIKLAGEAAEAPDIDDAPQNSGRFHILVRHAARDLIDDQIDTAAGGFNYRVGPRRIVRIDRYIGAEFFKPGAPGGIARCANHQLGTEIFSNLQPHQADAGTGTLNEHRLAGLEVTITDQRVMHSLKRNRQRRRLFETHICCRKG